MTSKTSSFTKSDIAAMRGVHRCQPQRWIDNGQLHKLPAFRVMANGRIVFMRESVEAWLKANNLPSLESFEKERAL